MDEVFKCIYKILRYLKIAMDYEESDLEQISAKALNISQNKWNKIMEMLVQNGYIQGISIKYGISEVSIISECNVRITLKGLEYLSENTLMKRAYKIAKGINDISPKI